MLLKTTAAKLYGQSNADEVVLRESAEWAAVEYRSVLLESRREKVC